LENNIEIRLATITDLNAIEKIGDTLFDYPIKKSSAIEYLNDSRHHLVLAFDQENVVGMTSGFHYVHPDKDPSLFIDEVGVIDAYRNRGVARRLIKFLCLHGKKMGLKEAWVLTERSNEAAKKAYIAAGGIQEDTDIVLFEFKL